MLGVCLYVTRCCGGLVVGMLSFGGFPCRVVLLGFWGCLVFLIGCGGLL